jgi:hypothetical protein
MPKGNAARARRDDGYTYSSIAGAHRASACLGEHREIDAPAPERAENLRTISQRFR